MKLAHNIKINVFVKPEDDETKLKEKLLSLVPFDIEKEKIKFKRSSADGFDHKKIIILEVDIEKDRHIREFLDSFKEKLGNKQVNILLEQDNRLDEECSFFIRLDKQKLLEKNELVLTDGGDCFHITINIAAFPKKREKAKEVVKIIFG